jgi:lysophospholipase L1-like esterase
MIGQEWEVKNFGVSGATLLKQGDRPYWKQKAFEEAKAYYPDVVIIKLGTNDTKPQNWKFKEDYVSDYTAMINEFKALPSKPFVIICFPVPAYPERWGIRDSIIKADLMPMIKKVAKQNHIELINLYKPLSNHAAWFPDKIHPNKEGAGKIAEVISKKLLKFRKKILRRNQ